jgi:hypothetical protein
MAGCFALLSRVVDAGGKTSIPTEAAEQLKNMAIVIPNNGFQFGKFVSGSIKPFSEMPASTPRSFSQKA